MAIFKEMSETERSTLAVELQARVAADKSQLDAAKAAAEIQNSEMQSIAKLLLGPQQGAKQ